jgi:hypothetical protein
MYKILHLPTGTHLKYKDMCNTKYDWPFTSKASAEKVCRQQIVVDYEKEIVTLAEIFPTGQVTIVLQEHLEIIEVPDD